MKCAKPKVCTCRVKQVDFWKILAGAVKTQYVASLQKVSMRVKCPTLLTSFLSGGKKNMCIFLNN